MAKFYLSAWDVAGEVHGIVQNPQNFDHVRLRHTVDDKMPPSTPTARDVERPQAWANVIACDATRDIGAAGELRKSLDENLLVPTSLARAEHVHGPLKNGLEIMFGRLAEAD
jgi:hypothetical protein